MSIALWGSVSLTNCHSYLTKTPVCSNHRGLNYFSAFHSKWRWLYQSSLTFSSMFPLVSNCENGLPNKMHLQILQKKKAAFESNLLFSVVLQILTLGLNKFLSQSGLYLCLTNLLLNHKITIRSLHFFSQQSLKKCTIVLFSILLWKMLHKRLQKRLYIFVLCSPSTWPVPTSTCTASPIPSPDTTAHPRTTWIRRNLWIAGTKWT